MKSYKVIKHNAGDSEDTLERQLNAATRDEYRVTDIFGVDGFVYAICTKEADMPKIGGKLGS